MNKILGVLLLLITVAVLGACGKDASSEVDKENSLPDTEIIDTMEIENDKKNEPEVKTTKEQEKEDDGPSDTMTEEAEIDLTGMAMNPLTGEYIPEEIALRRPIGIMINNHHKAQPQSGLSQADVIYEALVEGGIARLFAVFNDFDAEKIGPVRSARHYFLDFAFDFDSLYVHYGQSPQAQVAFKKLNPANMNGLSYLDTIMCFQDPSRKRPHSTYTSYKRLLKAWDLEKYRKGYREDLVNKFNFTDEVPELEQGQKATKVTLDYSYYQYAWFDYDQSTQTYLRNQFDAPQIDVETGEQLAFDNILIQIADVWKIKGDSEGRLDIGLIDEGKGYYISHGKSIPITWKKTSHYNPTQYYTEEGNLLEMHRGKTWISIFPSYRPKGIIIE